MKGGTKARMVIICSTDSPPTGLNHIELSWCHELWTGNRRLLIRKCFESEDRRVLRSDNSHLAGTETLWRKSDFLYSCEDSSLTRRSQEHENKAVLTRSTQYNKHSLCAEWTAAFPTDVQDKKLISWSVLIERQQRFLHHRFSLPGATEYTVTIYQWMMLMLKMTWSFTIKERWDMN